MTRQEEPYKWKSVKIIINQIKQNGNKILQGRIQLTGEEGQDKISKIWKIKTCD